METVTEIANDKEKMSKVQENTARTIKLKQQIQEEKMLKTLQDLQGDVVSLPTTMKGGAY